MVLDVLARTSGRPELEWPEVDNIIYYHSIFKSVNDTAEYFSRSRNTVIKYLRLAGEKIERRKESPRSH